MSDERIRWTDLSHRKIVAKMKEAAIEICTQKSLANETTKIQ